MKQKTGGRKDEEPKEDGVADSVWDNMDGPEIQCFGADQGGWLGGM